MLRHLCSRVYLARGRRGSSAALMSVAAKVPSYIAKVDDNDDVSLSPVKIYQGSSTLNSFHVHDSCGSVRFFSGIRNIPRDEALKYMPRLKKANSTEAIYILEDIERDGFIPDVFHYSAAISKCAKDGKLDEAKKIFGQMKQNKVAPNGFTLNSLIDACANAGDVEEAVKYLREMEEKHYLWPGVQSFSGAISACEKAGNWEKAIELLRESEHREIPPDVIIYAATISACGKGGQTKKALDLFIEMENRGIEPNGITFNAAISACEKGGGEHTETALALFRQMCNRNICPTVITYGATISACEKGGAEYTDTALQLFEEMKEHGVEPDVIVFSAITKTCYDNKRYLEAKDMAEEAVSLGFLSPLEAESKEWDLHGMGEAFACMLVANALVASVDTASFRNIRIVTGKGKKSEEGPVLRLKVPAFFRDVAGLDLSPEIKHGKLNEGAFILTKMALKKWAKSDDFNRFRALLAGEEKE